MPPLRSAKMGIVFYSAFILARIVEEENYQKVSFKKYDTIHHIFSATTISIPQFFKSA